MYNAKRYGDRNPPWRTPHETGKQSPKLFCHLIVHADGGRFEHML